MEYLHTTICATLCRRSLYLRYIRLRSMRLTLLRTLCAYVIRHYCCTFMPIDTTPPFIYALQLVHNQQKYSFYFNRQTDRLLQTDPEMHKYINE